jgi:tetratricopeptide (TPR) repeat protein
LSTLVDQLREQHRRLDALSIRGDSQFTDIRAVISWSYTALTPQAARLFRLLGLHPGPDIGTLAAASLIGLSEQGTHNLLTELTRAHLLEQHIPYRYQFHDILRTYAIEQAATEEPERQRRAALHRVLDYYLHTSFAAIQHIVPHRNFITLQVSQLGTVPGQIADHKQAWEWFTAEHTVLLDAIDHAATDGFDTHAWQLPWTLSAFLNRRGHWDDYAITQQTAVAAADRLGDRVAQALALCLLGHAHARLGRSTDALDSLQQALMLQEELSDHDGQAHTRLSIAWLCERQSQYTEALTHAQHALDLSRVTGHHMGQANALNALGWYHARLGRYRQALTHCQQALNLYRELGDRMGVASTLDSLGDAHHHLGQPTQAITHYQQAIALFHDVGDHYNEANTLTRFGDIHHAMGDFAAARDVWQQALTIYDQLGHPDVELVRAKLAALDNDPNTGVNNN